MSPGPGSDDKNRRRLSILSTEDDPLIRVMLAELLVPDGHAVEFARNSDDFFSLISKRAYDLLILDVNVPGMNGYQIAREVGARFGDGRPKIMLFTGRDTQEERGLVAASGADAVLEKGAPLPKIAEVIHKLTGIADAQAPRTPPPTPETKPPAAAPYGPAALPPEPAATREDVERLQKRVSAVLAENASVSSRIEAMQRRFSDLEKTLTVTRKDFVALRLMARVLGALMGLLGLTLALALLVKSR